MGNITAIRDNAQQTIYFRNQRVEPSNDFTYDAIYRLTQATGREHLGLGGNGNPLPPRPSSYNDAPRIGLLSPNDGNAMGTYVEQYQYDPVGNFLKFIHQGSLPTNPGWTRSYSYDEPSQLESGKVSNRLSSTAVGGAQSLNEAYAYDLHGNMTSMPQLQAMQWDFKDEMQMSQRQAVNASDTDGVLHQGERTYDVYDGTGQRARKVTESSTGVKRKERFYLGGFEDYREYDGTGAVALARQTLHVMDDKQRVALMETRTQGSDGAPAQLVRYQFSNHLGSASLELDDVAQVISYEEYCPYGNTSYLAGRSVTEVSLKRYRYSGMERDEESGLNYHGARYYAVWLGRWASCDPAGLVDGYNLYRMAGCNPIRFTDQTGNDSTETTDVVPAIKRYLEKSNIPYASEVGFEFLDKKTGEWVKGRFDIVFRDPKGRLVIPEAKGLNVDKLHGNQRFYSDELQENGGIIRFTAGDRKLTQVGGLNRYKKVQLTRDNYFRMGKKDLNDFENALQQITGGKRIVGRYFNQNRRVSSFHGRKGISCLPKKAGSESDY